MRKPKGGRRNYEGTSMKSTIRFRASKNNPYVCDQCGYRSTRYGNMTSHLERVHGDFATDPRAKSIAIKEGIVAILKQWKAF